MLHPIPVPKARKIFSNARNTHSVADKKNRVQGTWAPDGLTGDHQGGPSDPGNFASWKPLEAMAEIELEDVWRFAYKKWWLSMASWKTYLWKRQSVSPYQVGYATFNKRASTSKARHCPPLWPPPWDLEDPARKNWISPMCVCDLSLYIYILAILYEYIDIHIYIYIFWNHDIYVGGYFSVQMDHWRASFPHCWLQGHVYNTVQRKHRS